MSKVYFTDMRTSFTENLPKKLTRLIDRAGLGTIDFDHKFVAIKIHFGEMGNLAYLRPQYARALAAYIKERGGLPFLTDCNTLYVGSRKNALEHIETAYINGYTPYATGCQVIIADGVRGTDEAYIPIGCEEVKTAKIGRAIADADIIISLNHFKGHEDAGFGGALKNLGMGSGSRAGKMEMHYDGKPVVDRDRLPQVRDDMRQRRHTLRKQQGRDRPRQLRGLRPLHSHMQLRRHKAPQQLQRGQPEQAHRGIRLCRGKG